jgi:hypothetical protein
VGNGRRAAVRLPIFFELYLFIRGRLLDSCSDLLRASERHLRRSGRHPSTSYSHQIDNRRSTIDRPAGRTILVVVLASRNIFLSYRYRCLSRVIYFLWIDVNFLRRFYLRATGTCTIQVVYFLHLVLVPEHLTAHGFLKIFCEFRHTRLD